MLMSIRNWFQPPRHVLAIFIAVALVSAAALAWLMWLLLQQDKTVETQRRRERLEQMADRIAAVMQSTLADLDRAAEPPAGVVFVAFRAKEIVVKPEGGLLYYPETPALPEPPMSRFAAGEQAEFARNDLRSAAATSEALGANADAATRAGALVRLARVHRKMKEPEAAIRAYSELLNIKRVNVSGLPADLIAREGRATVFHDERRSEELRQEAAAFRSDLQRGRWQLTKPQYEFYLSEAESWLAGRPGEPDLDSIARAEAVEWLWKNRNSAGSQFRRLVDASGTPAFVASRATSDGLIAVVAGPSYLNSLCRDALPERTFHCAMSDAEGRFIVGQAPPSHEAVVRTAAASKLPWTLHVSAIENASQSDASPRRSLLLWVAAVLTVIWFTGAAFILRAIRREARVAQLQSDFVAAVSHEFRSPLSSLCQISEMLSGDRLNYDDMRRQAYGVLARESERLRRLVEELLDFQRLEAGAVVCHFEQIDLSALLRSIVSDFQYRVAAEGFLIELRAPDDAVRVRADREALSRAITNLLDNAVKYSPEHRTVWVELASIHARVSIVVQDRGLGIPAGEQRRIFDRFVRGAESKARRIKGTGIGLAIVRRIVEAHGGEILLTSQPGKGSRFTISIPAGAAS
jgi:signal transduction histidine kinase